MDSTQVIRRPPIGPMGRIVRIAVIVVTVALVFASTFNVLLGQRDIAVLFALAAPLGCSAWGFARAGQHEAAVVLLSSVLVAVVTLTLYLSPLGVHDHAVIAYAGVLLFNALLLSRKSFFFMAFATLVSATLVFVCEFMGLTNSRMGTLTGWPALVDFLLITAIVGFIGRTVAEILFGSLGDAQQDAIKDPVTGLSNRKRFIGLAVQRLRAIDSDEFGVLVVADIDNLRRMNHVVGYVAADRILAEVARRLTAAAPGALVARIGDDEFAILDTGLADEAAAHDFAVRCSAAMRFEFAGVSVQAAAGFSIYPRDANGLESLLMGADNMLAQAKLLTDGRVAGTWEPKPVK
jgi:diguanylate cyclase (GGDEF)-like protein